MSSKILRGGKEKKKEEEAGKGGKRGGLTDISCHLQTPGVTGLFPGLPEKRGLELSHTGLRVLSQKELISLQSSAQAEALQPNSCIQDQGIRKPGRIQRARRGKREGNRERSIKSLVPY